MDWWEKLPYDRQCDFIAYLKKIDKLKNLSFDSSMDQKIIRELIIPILTKGGAWIPEDLSRVNDLANIWGTTNMQLVEKIKHLWDRMVELLSTKQAGIIVGRSTRTMQRWAFDKKIHATWRLNKGVYWYFTREVLIDCLK